MTCNGCDEVPVDVAEPTRTLPLKSRRTLSVLLLDNVNAPADLILNGVAERVVRKEGFPKLSTYIPVYSELFSIKNAIPPPVPSIFGFDSVADLLNAV